MGRASHEVCGYYADVGGGAATPLIPMRPRRILDSTPCVAVCFVTKVDRRCGAHGPLGHLRAMGRVSPRLQAKYQLPARSCAPDRQAMECST